MSKKELENRFYECTAKLKALGFRGEVILSNGVVLVAVTGKNNAKPWRKAFKAMRQKSGLVVTETRPTAGQYLFSVILA